MGELKAKGQKETTTGKNKDAASILEEKWFVVEPVKTPEENVSLKRMYAGGKSFSGSDAGL